MNLFLVLLFIALSGCASTEPQISREEFNTLKEGVHSIRNEEAGIVQSTQEHFSQLEYFISHDKCFIDYSVCLGEKKEKHKACWDSHEACVVSVYHQWKDMPK